MGDWGLIVETREDGSIKVASDKFAAIAIKDIISEIWDTGEIGDRELPKKTFEKNSGIREDTVEELADINDLRDHMRTNYAYEAIWINGDIIYTTNDRKIMVKPKTVKEYILLICLSNAVHAMKSPEMGSRSIDDCFEFGELKLSPPSFLKSDDVSPEDCYEYIEREYDVLDSL